MRKTVALVPLLLVALLVAGCSTLTAVGTMLGSQITFTQPQLQHALNRSFPKQYDKLGGLLSLRLTNPSLSIPYSSRRLHLKFDVRVSSLASTSLDSTGRFALSSGLHYNPDTRGLHLQDPVIESFDMDGSTMSAPTRELLNAWLSDYAREEPVYQLGDSLQQRIAAHRVRATDIGNGVVVMELGQ